MCDFIEPALLEIFTDFAAVDAVLGGGHAEDFAEELKSAPAVTFEIRKDFAHVEVTLCAEAARIQEKIARNWNAHDGAPDVDVGEIEGFPVEGDKALRPDLPDVGPEIRKQFPLIRLAVGA